MDHEETLVTIRAIQHHAYCPRLYALIHIEGVFLDNLHTTLGHHAHKRVNTHTLRHRGGVKTMTALTVYSHVHGLMGVADKVELSSTSVTPIETKVGRKKHKHYANEIQVAAQALCLEEMFGVPSERGFIYYADSRDRVEVPMTAVLQARVLHHATAIRALNETFSLPAPVWSGKCRGCSLRPSCLPEGRQ